MRLFERARWLWRRNRAETTDDVVSNEAMDPAETLREANEAIAAEDFAGAIGLFRRVIDSGERASEGNYGAGVAAIRIGRTEEGLTALAAAMDAGHPEAPLRLAEFALAENRQDDAARYLRRALMIKPDLAEAYLALGKLETRQGHDAEAGRCYQRAFELSTFAEPGLRFGEWLLVNDDAAGARGVFRAVLDRAPQTAEAEYFSGIAALELGDLNEAAAAFHRALQIKPDYAEANSAAAFGAIFPARGPLSPPKSKRQTICIPAMQFRSGWLGGQIYLLNFARIMSTLPKAIRPRLVVILMNDWRQRHGFGEIVEGLSRCEAVVAIFDEGGELVFANSTLLRYLGTDDQTRQVRRRKILSRMDWTFPVLYPSWGNATAPRPIYWIPDFQHRFWPGYFAPVEVDARNRDIGALAARNVPIVFSSRDAASHFERFHPAHRGRDYVWHFHTGHSESRPIGNDDQFAALGLPQRFYYTPNQFWPHKNHETLLRGLRLLLDRGCDVTFVCTGSDLRGSTDPYHLRLLALAEELRLGAHLRLVGVLPREVQSELFRRACAIVQPSLFEGWSTVIEDARSLGRPMIVSDIPVHREQIGGEAVFFSPQDPASLAQAIAALDPTLTAGPDLAREAAARARVAQLMRESAGSFLEILNAEAQSVGVPDAAGRRN